MARRYAEGTSVAVASSQAEMTSILMKHGCDTMAWGRTPDSDTLMFALDGHQFRFTLVKPTPASMRERLSGEFAYPHNVDWATKAEAEWRRVWRAHVLLLKAKLEFVSGGDTTLEREFLPYAVLPDGRVVGDLIESGALPLLEAGG